jgi:formyl-CoA transferase
MDTMELSEDPSMREREIFVTVDHPVRGAFTMPGWPVKLSRSYVPVTAAPLLGADNETVYGSWLGYSREQLADLKEEGAI